MSMTSANRENSPVVESVKTVVSMVATCIGLAVIVIGLKYAIDIFQLIFTFLHAPASLTEPIQQVASSFGGNAFDIKLTDRTIPVAKLVALLLYCCGLLLTAFLTMALMQVGAKIVSLTAGDVNAVKRILQSAFGSRGRSKEALSDQESATRGR